MKKVTTRDCAGCRNDFYNHNRIGLNEASGSPRCWSIQPSAAYQAAYLLQQAEIRDAEAGSDYWCGVLEMIDIRDCRVRDLRDAGDRAFKLIQRPAVGSRWTPEHVVRQDTSSGFFEEINAPSSRLSDDAIGLQAALLTPYRGGGGLAWRLAQGLFVVALFGAAGVGSFLYLAR
jgi:hypothetical protein